jgi:predicted metal-dependent HD superfamily phosphohydrolase
MATRAVDQTALRARWRALWGAQQRALWPAAGAGDDGERIYADLVARYAEPHRAYHTLEHVHACLLHLDGGRRHVARPVEVELALWFHDAIYDLRRSDNEERSAQLAEEALLAAGIEGETAARVGELIRLTTHEREGLTGDGAILCDADLAILGAEPAEFDAYDAAIRREYAWVPAVVYWQERARVLARFLERRYLYHTPYFRERFEARARENLERRARALALMDELH